MNNVKWCSCHSLLFQENIQLCFQIIEVASTEAKCNSFIFLINKTTKTCLEQNGSANSLHEWHKLDDVFRFDTKGNTKCILEVSSQNAGCNSLLTFIVIRNTFGTKATGAFTRSPLNSAHLIRNCFAVYGHRLITTAELWQWWNQFYTPISPFVLSLYTSLIFPQIKINKQITYLPYCAILWHTIILKTAQSGTSIAERDTYTTLILNRGAGSWVNSTH